MDKKKINLSVVIPVFNEEKRFPQSLKKIVKFLEGKKYNYEIIIVDDGSLDATAKYVNRERFKNKRINLLTHTTNLGKGSAVKTGMLASKGKLVLMTDCDLSTPIEEIDTLLEYINKYPIVIGSRRLKSRKLGNMPEMYRTLLGDVYYEMLRMILLPNIKDTNCGFKLFKHEVIKPIFSRQRMSRWGYDAEVLFIANELGYSIKEVPVTWSHVTGSKVKVVDAVIRTLGELLKIKVNNWKGLYDKESKKV